jgi:hypothetical protein
MIAIGGGREQIPCGSPANRCDLSGTAEQAVCLAALTSNPEQAGISASFSVSIRKRIKRAMERLRGAETDLP